MACISQERGSSKGVVSVRLEGHELVGQLKGIRKVMYLQENENWKHVD